MSLAEHVLAEHVHGLSPDEEQGLAVDEPFLVSWHAWEHDPVYGPANHAHDSFTARRRSLPFVPAP